MGGQGGDHGNAQMSLCVGVRGRGEVGMGVGGRDVPSTSVPVPHLKDPANCKKCKFLGVSASPFWAPQSCLVMPLD